MVDMFFVEFTEKFVKFKENKITINKALKVSFNGILNLSEYKIL